MNTQTLQRSNRPSIFKSSNTRPIGPNTRNKCFNLPDEAADILESIATPTEGAFIRESIALRISLINERVGRVFVRACKISNALVAKAVSILSPGSPEEKAEAFKASDAELLAERQSAPAKGVK